jgi:lipid A 3-O-deacylase
LGWSAILSGTKSLFRLAVILVLMTGMAAAQSSSNTVATVPAVGATGVGVATTNPIRQGARPLVFGVLMQSGFGVTENRGSFKFAMAGIHAGKVLTGLHGSGMLRGDFELGAEAFPFWQSYTPTSLRQNCVYVPGQFVQQASCSAPFKIGGTFTGWSITPAILRWNFAGTKRFAPWVQGAGGVLWTNHKYPAFGGPPVNATGGLSYSTIGDNGANADTSVWNFTPQFGVGVHYFTSPRRSIDLGANAIHISSASLGDKNPGVNASVQFTLGYSWWK